MVQLIVTNFNRNFTGVSATAAAVIHEQARRYDMALVGHALPGCPAPISLGQARARSNAQTIWHVRRNTEMRAALITRDVLRKPIRIAFTSAAIRRHSAVPRWLISRMDAVIATTGQAASYVPNVRAVVPHGVDTQRFFPAADRAAAWQALGYGGQAGIATIGRVRPEKGTQRFVHAMIELLPDQPGLVALIIGKTARAHIGFADTLRRTIAAAGLQDRILWLGEISPGSTPALMRALSVVMQLPTYEGYGMVPLEAMASGVPFVATDTGYYRAFSAGGRAGLITEPTGAAAAAATVLACTNMQSNARLLALEDFSLTREVDGIDALYQKIWKERV